MAPILFIQAPISDSNSWQTKPIFSCLSRKWATWTILIFYIPLLIQFQWGLTGKESPPVPQHSQPSGRGHDDRRRAKSPKGSCLRHTGLAKEQHSLMSWELGTPGKSTGKSPGEMEEEQVWQAGYFERGWYWVGILYLSDHKENLSVTFKFMPFQCTEIDSGLILGCMKSLKLYIKLSVCACVCECM